MFQIQSNSEKNDIGMLFTWNLANGLQWITIRHLPQAKNCYLLTDWSIRALITKSLYLKFCIFLGKTDEIHFRKKERTKERKKESKFKNQNQKSEFPFVFNNTFSIRAKSKEGFSAIRSVRFKSCPDHPKQNWWNLISLIEVRDLNEAVTASTYQSSNTYIKYKCFSPGAG